MIYASIPLLGLPLAAYLGLIIAAAWRRRPRRLAWIVGATLALATILALIWFVVDRRRMSPAEYYVADDAALLLVPAAYGVGLIWILGIVLRAIGRSLAWGWRKVRRKGKPRP